MGISTKKYLESSSEVVDIYMSLLSILVSLNECMVVGWKIQKFLKSLEEREIRSMSKDKLCYYLTISPNAFNMGLFIYCNPCLAHSDFTSGATLW